MKVYFSSGAHSELDSMRGIGVNTSELVKALEVKSQKSKVIVVDRSNADIVHFTKFRPFFVDLPFFKTASQKWILTIHDLIPLIYPEHYPSGIKGKIRFYINKFLIKKYVDRVITISETSKKDICRFLGVKPEIVDVVYLAPKSAIKKLEKGKWIEETKKKFNLPDKFILFDHGLNYNKNLKTLIEACNKINFPLVAIDEDTKNINNLDLNHPELKHLKGVNFSKVIRPGYVTDDELNKIYNLAYICIQPSFYEGFGLPPIQAMKLGCPVICSRTQALVEVCGDACLYFDTNSVDDLVEKLKILMSDNKQRNECIKRGYEQVKKYSWDKAAKETLKIYKKMI
jgi:glycosyltransferase involved in cell wall biosynthesis